MYKTIRALPGPKAFPIIGNNHSFIGGMEGKFVS